MATAQGLKAGVVGVAKYHLSPLSLVELAAFGAALLAGWEGIAAAIVAWHMLRMGAMALGALRRSDVREVTWTTLTGLARLAGHRRYGLAHGVSHGLSHSPKHGLGHGMKHEG